MTDEQIHLYPNSLEDILIDLCGGCHSVKSDSNSHNTQLENLSNTLIGTMLVSSNYFIKMKTCPKIRIVGWNFHCKDLHSDARQNFILWHKNGRLRSS